jgi:hypothetical protein
MVEVHPLSDPTTRLNLHLTRRLEGTSSLWGFNVERLFTVYAQNLLESQTIEVQ